METPPTPSSQPPLPEAHPAVPSSCRFNAWLFFGCLLAPAVVSLFATTFLGEEGMAIAVIIALVGSVIAGLICGIHFARSMAQLTKGAKIGLGIVMVVGCAGGAFLLAFGGCALGATFASRMPLK